MSFAHFLLYLNELGNRDKMRGLSSILSHFRNEFDEFNKTGARILDSVYHRALKLLQTHFFGGKRRDFVIFMQRYIGRHYVTLLNL